MSFDNTDTGGVITIDPGQPRICAQCGWIGNVHVDEDEPPAITDPDPADWYEHWKCPQCGWEHDEKIGPFDRDPDTAPGGHDFEREND